MDPQRWQLEDLKANSALSLFHRGSLKTSQSHDQIADGRFNACILHLALWQVAEKSDVIFIAVKPQYVGIVLKEMKGQLNKDSIIVSIAAGVPLAAMKVTLGQMDSILCVLGPKSRPCEREHNKDRFRMPSEI